MAEHTKGPWRACGDDRGGCECHMVWSIPSDAVVGVAIKATDTAYTDGEGLTDEDEVRANARLISSAPDLLEAADNAVEAMASAAIDGLWQGEPGNRHNILRPHMRALEAAIAKAKGEA